MSGLRAGSEMQDIKTILVFKESGQHPKISSRRGKVCIVNNKTCFATEEQINTIMPL